MSEVTSITKRTAQDERLAAVKAQNAMAAQIRGQMWAKDASQETIRAVAEYCRQNGLDPVRHVELLGGRVYLTATLYEERAAPLIQRGIVIPREPDFINADARLDALEAAGDEWAKGEKLRRLRLRIEHNVPEKAAAAVVFRIDVAASGRSIVGVNWCGGGVRQRDPVGDTEPTKTAVTRAARRAWKQIAEVVPSFGDQFVALEKAAEVTGEVVQSFEAASAEQRRLNAPAKGYTMTTDYSEDAAAPRTYDPNAVAVTEVSDDAFKAARARVQNIPMPADPYEEDAA